MAQKAAYCAPDSSCKMREGGLEGFIAFEDAPIDVTISQVNFKAYVKAWA